MPRIALLIAPVWNWNWFFKDIARCKRAAFNRTSLELKLLCLQFCLKRKPPFNRTSLELKHNLGLVGRRDVSLLLIAPVWNWNDANSCQINVPIPLLIAPVWNWNALKAAIVLWNSRTFNRTSLELKPSLSSRRFQMPTFNRTSLELKRKSSWARRCVSLAFNRTSLELKLIRLDNTNRRRVITFNRTSLELKLYRAVSNFAGTLELLIAPVWNWNQNPAQQNAAPTEPFNRTSLELKRRIIRFVDMLHLRF